MLKTFENPKLSEINQDLILGLLSHEQSMMPLSYSASVNKTIKE
jgi:hypothetical protein